LRYFNVARVGERLGGVKYSVTPLISVTIQVLLTKLEKTIASAWEWHGKHPDGYTATLIEPKLN